MHASIERARVCRAHGLNETRSRAKINVEKYRRIVSSTCYRRAFLAGLGRTVVPGFIPEGRRGRRRRGRRFRRRRDAVAGADHHAAYALRARRLRLVGERHRHAVRRRFRPASAVGFFRFGSVGLVRGPGAGGVDLALAIRRGRGSRSEQLLFRVHQHAGLQRPFAHGRRAAAGAALRVPGKRLVQSAEQLVAVSGRWFRGPADVGRLVRGALRRARVGSGNGGGGGTSFGTTHKRNRYKKLVCGVPLEKRRSSRS